VFNGYNHRVARGDLGCRDQMYYFPMYYGIGASEVRLQILLRTKENTSLFEQQRNI